MRLINYDSQIQHHYAAVYASFFLKNVTVLSNTNDMDGIIARVCKNYVLLIITYVVTLYVEI